MSLTYNTINSNKESQSEIFPSEFLHKDKHPSRSLPSQEIMTFLHRGPANVAC